MRKSYIILAAALSVITLFVFTSILSATPKIIMYSWGANSKPVEATKHKDYIDTLPLDGIMFNDYTGRHLMNFDFTVGGRVGRPGIKDGLWTYDQCIDSFAPLTIAKPNSYYFKNVKYNFGKVAMRINSGLFSDTDWSLLVENYKNYARACKDLGFTGIIIDDEINYNSTPSYWNYWEAYGKTPNPLYYTGRTLVECHMQARLRGKQIMEAIISEFPDAVVLLFHGPYRSSWASNAAANSGKSPNPPTLVNHCLGIYCVDWMLDGAFVSGFVEASADQTTSPHSLLVDGGEFYDFRPLAEFQDNYQWRKYGIIDPAVTPTVNFLDNSLRSKWSKDISVGFGLFASERDYDTKTRKYGNWHHITDMNVVRTTLANALRVADDYIWQDTEWFDWFCDPDPATQSTGDLQPAPTEWIEAFKLARLDAAIDTVVPAVTITSPTTDTSYISTQGTLNLAGTATDNYYVKSVVWSIDGVGSGNCTMGANNAWTVDNVPVPLGINHVVVTVTDKVGNTAADTLDVINDNEPPTLSITILCSDSLYYITKNTINIGGTVTDNNLVESVTWSSDKGKSGNCTQSGDNWTVNDIALSLGSNVITVSATDNYNNTATKSITIVVDNINPQVSITSPTNTGNYSTNNTAINVSGVIVDATPIKSLLWKNQTGNSGSCIINGNHWSVANVPLVLGSNTITITAIDSADNTGESVLNVNMDNVAPLVNITVPTDNGSYSTSKLKVTVGGTVYDLNGIKSVTWNTDSDKTGKCTLTNGEFDKSVPLHNGDNVITVSSEDIFGNIGQDEINVNVDNQPPSLEVGLPSAKSTKTGPVDFTITYTGADTITLSASDVLLLKRGTATGSVSVLSATPNTKIVRISNIAGFGTLSILIKKGTASDSAGNRALASKASLEVNVVDNGDPEIVITTPTKYPLFGTTVNKVSFGGTFNFKATSVTWANAATGISGKCSFKAGKYAASIPLKLGENVITATAKDEFNFVCSDSIVVTYADNIAPIVKIASPSSTGKYTTKKAVVSISGKSSDNENISKVTWENTSNGSSGICIGTKTWSAKTVPLQIGENIIIIRAVDSSALQSFAKIVITKK